MENRLPSAASPFSFFSASRILLLTISRVALSRTRMLVPARDAGLSRIQALTTCSAIFSLSSTVLTLSSFANASAKFPVRAAVTAALIDFVSCRTACVNSTVGKPSLRINQKGLPCSIAPVCFSSPRKSSRAPVVLLISSIRWAWRLPSCPASSRTSTWRSVIPCPPRAMKLATVWDVMFALLPSSAAADDVGANAINAVPGSAASARTLTSVDFPEPATP